MKEIIKIGKNEYTIKSSAYTQFKYKDFTGRRMLDDIQQVANIGNLSSEEQISKIEDVIDLLLKLVYVMIEEADNTQVVNYEEFLKSIDSIFDEVEWITKVIQVATAPFSGGIQTIPQNQ